MDRLGEVAHRAAEPSYVRTSRSTTSMSSATTAQSGLLPDPTTMYLAEVTSAAPAPIEPRPFDRRAIAFFAIPMAMLTILGWVGDAFAPRSSTAPRCCCSCATRGCATSCSCRRWSTSFRSSSSPWGDSGHQRSALLLVRPALRRRRDPLDGAQARHGAAPVLWAEKAVPQSRVAGRSRWSRTTSSACSGATAWPGPRSRSSTSPARSSASWACARSAPPSPTDPRVERLDRRPPPRASPRSRSGSRSCCRPQHRAPGRGADRVARRARRQSSRPRPEYEDDGGVKNVLGERPGTLRLRPAHRLLPRRLLQRPAATTPACTSSAPQMTAEFLAFSQAQGNDLSTPVPEARVPRPQPGDRWCLCARARSALRRAWRRPCTSMRPTSRPSSGAPLEGLRRHTVDLPEP